MEYNKILSAMIKRDKVYSSLIDFDWKYDYEYLPRFHEVLDFILANERKGQELRESFTRSDIRAEGLDLPECEGKMGVGLFAWSHCNPATYELFNVDHLNALGDELRQLFGPDPILLFVCEGSGMFSWHMRRIGFRCIATDDYSWGGDDGFFGPHVEKLSAMDAVRKYSPTVVIASWVPLGSAVESDIVKTGVPLISIGEGEDGCTGNYEVWENPHLKLPSSRFNVCRTDHKEFNDDFDLDSCTTVFSKDPSLIEQARGLFGG